MSRTVRLESLVSYWVAGRRRSKKGADEVKQ
jgi:hypothetical protein